MKTEMKEVPKPITFPDAKYLKAWGKMYGPKVSIVVRDNHPFIHIMDFEFDCFSKALAFLQTDQRSIVGEDRNENEAAA